MSEVTWGSQGWICPKCGRALAPWMSFCPCYEEGSKVHYSTDTTGPSLTVPAPDWLNEIYSNRFEEQYKHIRDYMVNPGSTEEDNKDERVS